MIWSPVWLQVVTRMVLVVSAVAGTMMFAHRVVYHLEYAKLRRDHLSFNPLGTARSPG